MPIETEIKYRLSGVQFEQVRLSLKEFDAEYVGEDFEENVIYGGGILQELNAVLRIRKVGERTILTFKKRLASSGDVKKQIEHETVVEDASEIKEIIEHLGFEKRLVYEKRRNSWKFRDVEVVLDELPFGLFMEIEGTLLSIKEAEMMLGADEFEVEYKTYPHLTSEFGEPNADVAEARFPPN